ncbi:hypothetical protein ACET3Z_020618 [Daucus carota]
MRPKHLKMRPKGITKLLNQINSDMIQDTDMARVMAMDRVMVTAQVMAVMGRVMGGVVVGEGDAAGGDAAAAGSGEEDVDSAAVALKKPKPTT